MRNQARPASPVPSRRTLKFSALDRTKDMRFGWQCPPTACLAFLRSRSQCTHKASATDRPPGSLLLVRFWLGQWHAFKNANQAVFAKGGQSQHGSFVRGVSWTSPRVGPAQRFRQGFRPFPTPDEHGKAWAPRKLSRWSPFSQPSEGHMGSAKTHLFSLWAWQPPFHDCPLPTPSSVLPHSHASSIAQAQSLVVPVTNVLCPCADPSPVSSLGP